MIRVSLLCPRPNIDSKRAYLVDTDDLASGLLHLAETAKEIPETGLGNNLIGREDAHAIEGGAGVSLGGQMAPNDLVFLKTTWHRLSASRVFCRKDPEFAAMAACLNIECWPVDRECTNSQFPVEKRR